MSQQKLAEQTGKGLRHLQDMEKGRINPSFDMMASYINRLGINPNNLFYPDADKAEQEVRHLIGKFLSCTEDERQIMLKTLDCMTEQFVSQRYQNQAELR